MKSATLTLETKTRTFEVEVDFFYYPPEDPGGFGYRVAADVEIKKITVTAIQIPGDKWLKRSDLQVKEQLDLIASNLISDQWDKYKEQLIAEARSQ